MKKFFFLALAGLMFLVTSTASALPVRPDDSVTKIKKSISILQVEAIHTPAADLIVHNVNYTLSAKPATLAPVTAAFLLERTIEYSKVRPPHESNYRDSNKNLQHYPAGPGIRALIKRQ